MAFNSFDALFAYLNTKSEKFNIIFDEYLYLNIQKKCYVDLIFQRIVDDCLENINIVLYESHIGMMVVFTKHDNSLYGRFTS